MNVNNLFGDVMLFLFLVSNYFLISNFLSLKKHFCAF